MFIFCTRDQIKWTLKTGGLLTQVNYSEKLTLGVKCEMVVSYRLTKVDFKHRTNLPV